MCATGKWLGFCLDASEAVALVLCHRYKLVLCDSCCLQLHCPTTPHSQLLGRCECHRLSVGPHYRPLQHPRMDHNRRAGCGLGRALGMCTQHHRPSEPQVGGGVSLLACSVQSMGATILGSSDSCAALQTRALASLPLQCCQKSVHQVGQLLVLLPRRRMFSRPLFGPHPWL